MKSYGLDMLNQQGEHYDFSGTNPSFNIKY